MATTSTPTSPTTPAPPPVILREVTRGSLTSTAPPADLVKKDFKYLTSYNWLDKPTPSILVPGKPPLAPPHTHPPTNYHLGSPPLWAPKPLGTRVVQDTGLMLIDQAAHRSPRYPLEALLRALLTSTPDFDFAALDVITDRNNLSKLLSFASDAADDAAFRINVQRVGATTLLTRVEERNSELITGFRGFGKEFKKANTRVLPGFAASTGHYRVVSYGLAGLRCAVRFEVDAYDAARAGTTTAAAAPRAAAPRATPARVSADADALAGLLGAVSLGAGAEAGAGAGAAKKDDDVCGSARFSVTRCGTVVAQAAVIETKTRAVSRELDLAQVWPHAWFTGSPTLLVGYHRGGRFDEVRTTRTEGVELRTWERQNAAALGKLVALMKVIVEEARKAPGGRCVVVGKGKGTGKLTIQTTGKNSLPKDLRDRFVARV